MYRKTHSIRIDGLGIRMMYAKIVPSPKSKSTYDRLFGRFVGFYIKDKRKWKKVYGEYSGRPYVY